MTKSKDTARPASPTGANPKVDRFLETEKQWSAEMKKLRAIVRARPLTEELKWGKPCYTLAGANVVLIFGFKGYCALGFFKGSLLKDPQGVLVSPGEHSQAMRQLRFTSVREVADREAAAKAFIDQAIEIERAGRKVDFKEKSELKFPPELQQRLDKDPALKAAFTALTPGRQRGYVLHFSAATQAQTREARIDKYRPRILRGEGLHDR
ncbi:MAG TPA: DUF1801 domain-containing protein [Opitutaceae bacterium]|nr:DUF1801 domain-containing protein [Opitutaceae bacterium]